MENQISDARELTLLTNLEKQTVLIDVSVHLGTLGGVIIFFFKDITKILIGFSHLNSLIGN